MSQQRRYSSLHSEARPVPASESPSNRIRVESPERSQSRAAATARLASPVFSGARNTPPVRQIPTPSQLNADDPFQPRTPLAGSEEVKSLLPGPGESALANAIKDSYGGKTPPRFSTPPLRPFTPENILSGNENRGRRTSHSDSFQPSSQGRTGPCSPATGPDPEIVRRHLVGTTKGSSTNKATDPASRRVSQQIGHEGEDDFSSLQLQGGDVHRGIYRWARQHDAEAVQRAQRSKSFHHARPQPQDARADYQSILEPGGFRREYLGRAAGTSTRAGNEPSQSQQTELGAHAGHGQPFTSSFMEFLTLYGHFAGETIEEEDEADEDLDEDFPSDTYREQRGDGDESEQSALLGRRKRRSKETRTGKQGVGFTFLSLFKGFVGTGVLFLPRAFLNGGMLFSSMMLLAVAALSYYCFLLLTRTRLAVQDTYGNMGLTIYGRWLRIMINTSLVVSQLGFTSAYIIFTSENLQAFILAVSQCRTFIPIDLIILMQLAIFLPLSLYRNIGNLGKIALVADAFILAGLIVLYYYDIKVIADRHGFAPDIALFNRHDWTLFIGTAIFTFEGIGLLIPIQEGMKDPSKFPVVLVAVVLIITAVFTSMGALSYAAFGKTTKTIIISNLPQDNKLVNGVQFIYSLAILLSTPLQIFPVITILERGIFQRSGKMNAWVKWQKNVFRFFTVMLCGGIAAVGANDLDKFVALVGSFACVPLVYLYPPMLHIKAVANKPWQRIADVAIFVFGIAVMGFTTILTVRSWIDGVAHKEPGYCDR